MHVGGPTRGVLRGAGPAEDEVEGEGVADEDDEEEDAQRGEVRGRVRDRQSQLPLRKSTTCTQRQLQVLEMSSAH